MDGELVRLRVPGPELGRHIGLTMFALLTPVTQRTLQIMQGHWVHFQVVRRESMAMLDAAWKVLRKLGKQPLWLPNKMRLELVQSLASMPLLCCYLRSSVDPRGNARMLAKLALDSVSPRGSLKRDCDASLARECHSAGIVALAAVRESVDFAFHLALTTEPGAEQL
eukprot:6083260-Amphidinium_carterae.1